MLILVVCRDLPTPIFAAQLAEKSSIYGDLRLPRFQKPTANFWRPADLAEKLAPIRLKIPEFRASSALFIRIVRRVSRLAASADRTGIKKTDRLHFPVLL